MGAENRHGSGWLTLSGRIGMPRALARCLHSPDQERRPEIASGPHTAKRETVTSEKAARSKRAEQAMDYFLAQDEAAQSDSGPTREGGPTATPTGLRAPAAAAGWYADPSMVNTRRYWDGQNWTAHVAPNDAPTHAGTQAAPASAVPALSGVAGPGAPASPPSGPSLRILGQQKPADERAFAWTLAALPLAWVVVDYAFPQLSYSRATFLVGWILAGWLAARDAQKLHENGAKAPSAWWGFLLPPVYLIQRTLRAKSTPFIPILWFAAAGLYAASLFTFNNVWEFNDFTESSEIEAWFSERDIDADVTCPTDWVRPGDTFTCTAVADGDEVLVRVSVEKDGMYSWEVG